MPAPLAQRDGLDPVRVRVDEHLLAFAPDGRIGDVLVARFPPLADPAATPLARRLDRGDVVRADGRPWRATDTPRVGEEIWFHRESAAEDVPDVDLPILLHDEHLLVIDKPHNMATTPRGRHVLASALVRLRQMTGIAELSPLHRLDRRTAGVLAFGVRAAERGRYQALFAAGAVRKEYRARVALTPGGWEPEPGERRRLADRLVREREDLQTRVVPGEPNAVTDVEVAEAESDTAVLRLRPRTGRTHQLRAQLAHLGAPILGDDLYPRVRPEAECGGDLQLLAVALGFTDPVTGQERALRSRRSLPAPARAGEGER